MGEGENGESGNEGGDMSGEIDGIQPAAAAAVGGGGGGGGA